MRKTVGLSVNGSHIEFWRRTSHYALAVALLGHPLSASAQLQPPTVAPPADSPNQAPAAQTAPGAAPSTPGSPMSADPGQPEAGPTAAATPTSVQPPAMNASADAAALGEEPPELPPETKLFIASLFSVRLEFGGGAPFGDLIDAEKDAQVGVRYSDGTVKTATPTHSAFHIGVNLEVAMLRTKGFKLALRGGYLYTDITQNAEVGGGAYEVKKWDGQLLGMHAGLIGPVVYLGKKWYGSLQFLAGPVSGTLHPIPLGEQIEGISLPDYSVSGWMLRAGPGFGYAWKTFLLGGDLLYSRSALNLKEAIYADVGTSTALSSVSLNFHLGLHF